MLDLDNSVGHCLISSLVVLEHLSFAEWFARFVVEVLVQFLFCVLCPSRLIFENERSFLVFGPLSKPDWDDCILEDVLKKRL